MKDRVLVAYPASELPFVPPFEQFLKLLGFNSGMSGMVKEIGLEAGKVPPSEKTLKTAFKHTVTRSTAERIRDIMMLRIPEGEDLNELEKSLEPWDNLKLRSNGASWYPAISGLRKWTLKDRFPNCRAEQFIYRRINEEYRFLSKVKPIVSSPVRTAQERKIPENAMKQLLIDHTFVDQELLEKASVLPLSAEEAPQILTALWREIRTDFYYQLMCNLSLDIIDRFRDLGIQSPSKQELLEKGLMGSLAPRLDLDGKIIYPFARLLERWTHSFSGNPEKPMTWQQLSKAMPHAHDEKVKQLDPDSVEYKDLQEIAKQTRKRRLREWRGGVSPSDEQLYQFVVNLVPKDEDAYYTWLIARIAVMWGRFIDEESLGLEEGNADLMSGLMFRYQDVWAHYKDQAADLLAAW
jgi:hypothetical protein